MTDRLAMALVLLLFLALLVCVAFVVVGGSGLFRSRGAERAVRMWHRIKPERRRPAA